MKHSLSSQWHNLIFLGMDDHHRCFPVMAERRLKGFLRKDFIAHNQVRYRAVEIAGNLSFILTNYIDSQPPNVPMPFPWPPQQPQPQPQPQPQVQPQPQPQEMYGYPPHPQQRPQSLVVQGSVAGGGDGGPGGGGGSNPASFYR